MNSNVPAVKVTWDYTEHASHYDKRADYSYEAIDALLRATGCTPATRVAEIGAGTGKLTKELLKHGLSVRSVEPNDAMRAIGIQNTNGKSVTWSVGTGESTGLESASAHAVFFGSSFNVVDQGLTLIEVSRVLKSRGWFGCMWNHRDLDDPIQQHIESIIKSSIQGYSYGSRREDPTSVIASSALFSDTKVIERGFHWKMPKSDIIVAWRSHATLKRQAGSDSTFAAIIGNISNYLDGLPALIDVPYTTRIYYAQKLA
jgi:ubiquinone/menaquinone biosynthesis C-methylase UbiE